MEVVNLGRGREGEVMRPTCYMCRKRPARALTGTRDGMIYVNAVGIVMFCSLKCAANHALIWAPEEQVHWCPISNDWVHCAPEDCDCTEVAEAT